ncbi:HET-domain-containing protein [Bimuria novae-zelandiae CBS 107.79]|uniref:HET-domain-containing protein n=1 Tax=Bimuria novae-zelandiae CBS 107.79 TaxID=1447943 RepID=A0A6A5VL94_9PLEO|nr:HET-domain-containing protein [Bimuria novae-zelandiae CBS 107.79]
MVGLHSWRGPLYINVTAFAKNELVTRCIEYYSTDHDSHRRCSLIPLSQHVSTTVSLEAHSKMARQWLNYCLQHHDVHLCPANTHQRLPTRVICVGSPGSSPFLHEPCNGERGCWVALSYRWGRQNSSTTLKNLREKKEGFDLEQLPKTIRDAVVVTRGLGVQYLWVDAICIVQNEETPWIWKREAAEMCSVYENALLTIAAIDNEHSDTGLSSIDPRRQAVQLDLKSSYIPAMSIFARQSHALGYYGFMSSGRQNIHHSYGFGDSALGLLDNRGWTLQEITLSPRILWFSTCELGFSCPAGRVCECQREFNHSKVPIKKSFNHVRRNHPELHVQTLVDSVPRRPTIHDPELQGGSSQTWMIHWLDIVEDFTARNLTRATDRLPALHGLITAIQKRIGGECVAGLWVSDLPRQLLWHAADVGRVPVDMNACYPEYAPSWSWASVLRAITWTEHTEREMAWTIVSSHFTASDNYVLGSGTGSIIIRGYVLPALVEGLILYSRDKIDVFARYDTQVKLDGRADCYLWDHLKKKVLFIMVAELARVEHDTGTNTWTKYTATALLLEPVSQMAETFRRLGLVDHVDLGNWGAWRPSLLERTITLT